jgi:hypothetical protein
MQSLGVARPIPDVDISTEKVVKSQIIEVVIAAMTFFNHQHEILSQHHF